MTAKHLVAGQTVTDTILVMTSVPRRPARNSMTAYLSMSAGGLRFKPAILASDHQKKGF